MLPNQPKALHSLQDMSSSLALASFSIWKPFSARKLQPLTVCTTHVALSAFCLTVWIRWAQLLAWEEPAKEPAFEFASQVSSSLGPSPRLAHWRKHRMRPPCDGIRHLYSSPRPCLSVNHGIPECSNFTYYPGNTSGGVKFSFIEKKEITLPNRRKHCMCQESPWRQEQTLSSFVLLTFPRTTNGCGLRAGTLQVHILGSGSPLPI